MTKEQKIKEIIRQLNEMEVDGETMEYILYRTGMQYQMLRQLIMLVPEFMVESLIEERKQLTV